MDEHTDWDSRQDKDQPLGPGGDMGMEQIQHRQVSARVAEGVGRGVFSTGLLVMTGPNEFVLDFVLRMSRPYLLVARVVIPPAVMPSFIAALRDNLAKYAARFGNPPELPRPDPAQPRPGIQEIYDDLKIPDTVMTGSYANAVLISHSPAEFCFDFVTHFFPRSAVSSRVFLTAPNVPRTLELLTLTYEQYRKRLENPPPPPQQ